MIELVRRILAVFEAARNSLRAGRGVKFEDLEKIWSDTSNT